MILLLLLFKSSYFQWLSMLSQPHESDWSGLRQHRSEQGVQGNRRGVGTGGASKEANRTQKAERFQIAYP